MWERPGIEQILGKTLTMIVVSDEKDKINFLTSDGEKYVMMHHDDCCEQVDIEDICGDLNDLLNEPILDAREETSDKNPEGVDKENYGSFTWTFYILATIKGSVTIRWYGTSNGWYSESVDFDKIEG